MKTSNINKPIGDRLKHLALGLTAAAVLVAGTAPVLGQGNSGAGGTITYTDLKGANPRSTPPYPNGYVIHTFTTSGTLSLPASVTAADVLVVGGGGGGGAGGYLYNAGVAVNVGDTSVTVGGGGAGGTGTLTGPGAINGTPGSPSGFGSIQAAGGGYGACNNRSNVGGNGGSGGGGSGNPNIAGGNGTSGQGNAGGACNAWNNPYLGGGGGGAGAAGSAPTGGAGLSTNISGSTAWYAGGGGGGSYTTAGGDGGQGGGGNAGGNGTSNTGGGGGGGTSATGGTAGGGGSGIVIVRYPYEGPLAQFVITTVGYDALNDQLNLTWNSLPGATYTIENTQNLVDWDNLTTGIASGGPTTTRVVDAPQPGTFYRIRKE